MRNYKIIWTESENTTYQYLWDTDKSVFTGKFIALKVYSNSAPTNMVNIPKTHRTFYKYGKHNSTKWHRTRRERVLVCPGEAVLLQETVWLWQTKPIFQKKVKITKILLRLDCIESSYRAKRILATRRCKPFELGKDTTERAKWSSSELHLLFYYKGNKILRYVHFKNKSLYWKEWSQINDVVSIQFKKREKGKINRKLTDIIKIWAEINAIKTRKIIKKINETKSCFFKNKTKLINL